MVNKRHTTPQVAKKILGSLTAGMRTAEQEGEGLETQARESQAADQLGAAGVSECTARAQQTNEVPDLAPQEQDAPGPSAYEGAVVEAAAIDSAPSDRTAPEQPAADGSDSPARAITEHASSIESILDKPPLTQRIRDALALVDRVSKDQLCEQLGCAVADFKAAVTGLVEGKAIKEDAIAETLYLPLNDNERKEYREDLATAKRDERLQALDRIHDHHSYREDYRSWDEFLHHELCVDNPHDWWQTEKRRVRIQRRMDELGIKLKVPLNKSMAQYLNRVRNDDALFVACVTEFQSLPEDRQIAKRLGEIVERQLVRQNKLTSLRLAIPVATEQDLEILDPICAADHRWKNWNPEVQQRFLERVQASGRARECMLDLAAETKSQ